MTPRRRLPGRPSREEQEQQQAESLDRIRRRIMPADLSQPIVGDQHPAEAPMSSFLSSMINR